MVFTDASICIKQLLAITNGSLFNVETTSHIYFRLLVTRFSALPTQWMSSPSRK